MDVDHACGGSRRGSDKVQLSCLCWGDTSSSPYLHLLHATGAKVGHQRGHLVTDPSPIQIRLLPSMGSSDLVLLVDQQLLLPLQPQQGIQLLL